jgi:hypothetical protein
MGGGARTRRVRVRRPPVRRRERGVQPAAAPDEVQKGVQGLQARALLLLITIFHGYSI